MGLFSSLLDTNEMDCVQICVHFPVLDIKKHQPRAKKLVFAML